MKTILATAFQIAAISTVILAANSASAYISCDESTIKEALKTGTYRGLAPLSEVKKIAESHEFAGAQVAICEHGSLAFLISDWPSADGKSSVRLIDGYVK